MGGGWKPLARANDKFGLTAEWKRLFVFTPVTGPNTWKIFPKRAIKKNRPKHIHSGMVKAKRRRG